MRKRNGTHGAISVFLALILVPCILVSSIFVDLSRVHLSKSVAESSADLALNTLLTNYDADLKNWYGLVASCQSIEEFYEVSAEYFLRALVSQGMSDDEIYLLGDYYSHVTNDDTIYDLLRVEPKGESGAAVSEVSGVNLANAAFMKKEVVEFMKYRAPIEITTGLVERIKNDPTVSEVLEAKKNEPLVEDKQEFYESEGKLVEAAYYTYLAIKAYYTAASSGNLTGDRLQQEYEAFQAYQDAYREISEYAVSNLSNTGGLERYNRALISRTYYNDYYSNPSKRFSDVYSEKKTENGQKKYYIELTKVKTLVDDLEEKIDAFLKAKDSFQTAAQPVLNQLPYGDEDGQSNPIQWWVRMDRAVNASSGTNYTSQMQAAGENMLRAYSKVLAIDKCELKGTVPQDWNSLDDWKEKYGATDLLAKAESLQGTYLTAGVSNGSDPYLNAVSNLESVSSANYGRLKADNLYIPFQGENLNLNSVLAAIGAGLSDLRQELQGYVDQLTKAIDGDGGDTPSLDELVGYVSTYEEKLDQWTQTANGMEDTSMAQADRKEIEERKATVEIKKEDVAILKTRLTNIRSQMESLIAAIDELKWGGKSLLEVTSIGAFLDQAGIDDSRIGITNGELKSYAKSVFEEKFTPQSLQHMEHKGDSAFDPTINPETREVDTPELWVYLFEKYKETEDQLEQNKKERDDAKNDGKNKEKEAKDKNRYHGGGEQVPHAYSGDAVFDLSNAVSGIAGMVENLLKLDFTGMRDDLYATTYIMNMFSYAAFEEEGMYHLLEEKDAKLVTQLTLENHTQPGFYPSVKGEGDTDRNTWLSKDPRDHENKSLTNHVIQKSSNPAYCAEIEYILCGGEGKDNAETVKSVYNKIYGIRYGLNLVSGFQNFWAIDPALAKQKGNTSFAIYLAAQAVNLATSGIIPIAVTEAVLIPVLTIFETSTDLDRLEAGFPVELYKTEANQWWVSLETQSTENLRGIGAFMTSLKGIDPNLRQNTGKGIFYSDYLTMFVYLGLHSGAEEAMYQRMAEVIQFNMGKLTQNTGYSLEKSRLYFRLEADLQVKPMMITLPYLSAEQYAESGKMLSETDWCTYHVSVVRGYN